MMKLLTVEETADYLSVTKDTVRLWARTGRLRAINIGSSGRPTWRFDPEYLTAIHKQSGGIPEENGNQPSELP